MGTNVRESKKSLDNPSLDWILSNVRWSMLGAVLKGADIIDYARDKLPVIDRLLDPRPNLYISDRPIDKSYQE